MHVRRQSARPAMSSIGRTIRSLSAAAMALVLVAAPVSAAPLTTASTGGDWMDATTAECFSWVGRAVAPLDVNHVVLSRSIAGCLEEAMTVRKPGERGAVALYRRQPLTDLTVLCRLRVLER